MLKLKKYYHGGDGEIPGVHFFSEPIDLPTGVAENDGLGDGKSLVQIAQSVQLPFLALNRDIKLTNTLKGQLFFLDQDANGFPHEPGGDLQHVWGHGGGQEDNLDVGVEGSEHIVDLVLETTGQHLVGLVQDEHLDFVDTEDPTGNHVKDTAGGT